jgi:hypothetical protein
LRSFSSFFFVYPVFLLSFPALSKLLSDSTASFHPQNTFTVPTLPHPSTLNMGAIIDFLALIATIAVFAGTIYGVVLVTQLINSGVKTTKEKCVSPIFPMPGSGGSSPRSFKTLANMWISVASPFSLA